MVLSNGELCIAFDHNALIRDIYYPHVGLEDHVRGHYIHHVGVWVDGRISWFGDNAGWDIRVSSETDALAGVTTAINNDLRVELTLHDVVFHEKPILVRRVSVTNKGDQNRVIKLYFGHQFEIYKSHGSDTAYFDPTTHTIIHYKGHRVFIMSGSLDGERFEDYVMGRANFQGKEGSHRDADDGELSKNPIEHGPADSVMGLYASYAPGQSRTAYYTLSAAKSIREAHELHDFIGKKTPEKIIKETLNFWHAWVNAYQWNFRDLSPEHITLFKRSLMFMRAHVDKDGAIIASIDSDMLQYGLDTYSYMWPRDSAYVARALDMAGDTHISRRFFEFCRDVIHDKGYLMHKYLPDLSLGSSWHPWLKDGQVQLPIQEDETALVIWALYEHYMQSKDLEFLEKMYAPLVEKAANFLVRYRDEQTGLPDASYDLWERKRGISTYTSSTVFGALKAAHELSKILGRDANAEIYDKAAEEIREAIVKHLWDEKGGMFVNMLVRGRDGVSFDRTVDISSAYGIFSFGILPVDDPRLERAFELSVKTLSHGIPAGGIARFDDDDYYRVVNTAPGNPWVITTLFYAEYLIARAKEANDLARVRDIFSWVVRHAQPSGVLSEQMHPDTGLQIGATPLTWAHASYVTAVLQYLAKAEELGL
jgi:GH15 family glucan-1,4-alpha-glucosidase